MAAQFHELPTTDRPILTDKPPPAKMPSCIFDTCCGCIELRTGCLIIAYLNLVGEIILIAMGIAGLVGAGLIAADGEKDHLEIGAAVMAISIIMLLVVFFFLAFTIVLLVGLHQNKRGHVKAFLIYAVIFMVISIVMFFASFAGPISAQSIIQQIVTILLNIYFLLVLRSYYYKMDDKRPAIYNTA